MQAEANNLGRLLNIVASVSLLLMLIATAIVWIASYSQRGDIRIGRHMVSTTNGVILWTIWNNNDIWMIESDDSDIVKQRHFAGATHGIFRPDPEGDRYIVFTVVPFWMVATLLGLIGIRPLIIEPLRWRRRRRLISQKRCVQCGFDLRASSERCPECGMPIPSV